MHKAVIDPAHARVYRPSGRNGPTQAGPLTSSLLTDLLNGPLGDMRFSDGSTPGYRSGAISRSMLGLDSYFNERNHGLHPQSEFPSQSPSLWSPFDHHTQQSQPDPGTYDFTGSAHMWSQVSSLPLPRHMALTHPILRGKHISFNMPHTKIYFWLKTQHICACTNKT
jgi:hypothetical protein